MPRYSDKMDVLRGALADPRLAGKFVALSEGEHDGIPGLFFERDGKKLFQRTTDTKGQPLPNGTLVGRIKDRCLGELGGRVAAKAPGGAPMLAAIAQQQRTSGRVTITSDVPLSGGGVVSSIEWHTESEETLQLQCASQQREIARLQEHNRNATHMDGDLADNYIARLTRERDEAEARARVARDEAEALRRKLAHASEPTAMPPVAKRVKYDDNSREHLVGKLKSKVLKENVDRMLQLPAAHPIWNAENIEAALSQGVPLELERIASIRFPRGFGYAGIPSYRIVLKNGAAVWLPEFAVRGAYPEAIKEYIARWSPFDTPFEEWTPSLLQGFMKKKDPDPSHHPTMEIVTTSAIYISSSECDAYECRFYGPPFVGDMPRVTLSARPRSRMLICKETPIVQVKLEAIKRHIDVAIPFKFVHESPIDAHQREVVRFEGIDQGPPGSPEYDGWD